MSNSSTIVSMSFDKGKTYRVVLLVFLHFLSNRNSTTTDASLGVKYLYPVLVQSQKPKKIKKIGTSTNNIYVEWHRSKSWYDTC